MFRETSAFNGEIGSWDVSNGVFFVSIETRHKLLFMNQCMMPIKNYSLLILLSLSQCLGIHVPGCISIQPRPQQLGCIQ